MPTGVYDRKKSKRKGGKRTAVIPLSAIPARRVAHVNGNGAARRAKPTLEIARLQLAAEVVRVLQSILGGRP